MSDVGEEQDNPAPPAPVKTETKTQEKPAQEKPSEKAKPLATGGEVKPEEVKSVWADDWRENIAKQVGGTDAKAVAKELKRLQRFTDPSAVYAMGRELEARFSEGGLVKKPGKDAKPEEVTAFNKALGVPEKPEDYAAKLTLSGGKVLGDNDKPMFEDFAKRVHAKGATPEIVSEVVDWYYDREQKLAAEQYKADETYRGESQKTLNERWGASRDSNINAIGTLFATAPGGNDPENETGLMARVLGGRTSDGRMIGDDPDITAWLAQVAKDLNPMATVVTSTGGSPTDRLAEIRALRKADPDKYDADKKMQAEEERLIDAELRVTKRTKAA